MYAKGADCRGAGSALTNLKSKVGYWRANVKTAVFHPCSLLHQDHCRGAAIELPYNGTHTATHAEAKRDSQCKAGHVGPLCAACDLKQGYVLKFKGPCGKCASGEGEGVLTAVLLVLMGIGVLIMCLHKYGHLERAKVGLEKRTIKLRILYGFVQVVTRMAPSYNLHLPAEVAQFYNALYFLEVVDVPDLVGSASCMYPSNNYIT